MNSVQWQSSYEIGNRLLDSEHEHLFFKINDCIQSARNGMDKRELVACLQEIHACLSEHFDHEERAMLLAGVANFYNHKAQHDYLLERLKSEISEMQNVRNKKITAQGILFALYDWYVTHMSIEDGKIFQ